MRQTVKLEFIVPMVDVTFLCPNKKVTKEIVIGEALMPCSRTTNCTLPYVPHPRALTMPRDALTT